MLINKHIKKESKALSQGKASTLSQTFGAAVGSLVKHKIFSVRSDSCVPLLGSLSSLYGFPDLFHNCSECTVSNKKTPSLSHTYTEN